MCRANPRTALPPVCRTPQEALAAGLAAAAAAAVPPLSQEQADHVAAVLASCHVPAGPARDAA